VTRPLLRAAVTALVLVTTLTAAEASAPDRRLGERLYRDGLNARAEPIRALVGMPPSPISGARAACGACHEWNPAPGPASANAAPDLRWSVLAAAHAGPRPYTEHAFARTVNEGLDPSGSPLSHAMPRYSLSRSELAALVAFLQSAPAPKNDTKVIR